jgi:fructan beta-fructosidase
MKTGKSLAIALSAVSAMTALAAVLYHEPYRLQYHFSPARTWTNDPNGLVYYKGEFHLFYQNNPFGNKWGHMSWGHAASNDMLHWKELPVAIPEENGVMIFSGSVVIDYTNSSGLCHNPDLKDKSCLVAIYTGHTPQRQNQDIASSDDRGRTWKKYAGNPVIDLQMKDFRDPKVLWYEAGKKWVMAVSLPNEHRIRFFGSKNLLAWSALGDFGPAGATGGQWECPDLFELPADAKATTRKWVLVVNVNPGGIQGGSAAQYFVGNFDGHSFQNENPPEKTLWVDWGKDFYAVTSYFNSPPGDPSHYWIGWFSNWEYSNDEPTAPQRGAMAIPREVMLRAKPDGTRLIQEPVSSLALIHGTEMNARNRDIDAMNGDVRAEGFKGHEMEIQAVFERGTAREFGVLVHKGASQQTAVGVTSDGHAFIDRTNSGDVSFSPSFSGRHTAPIRLGKMTSLRILTDRSSVEVFVDDGETVISDRVFPAPDSDGIEFYSKGGTARIASLRMWKLKSVW